MSNAKLSDVVKSAVGNDSKSKEMRQAIINLVEKHAEIAPILRQLLCQYFVAYSHHYSDDTEIISVIDFLEQLYISSNNFKQEITNKELVQRIVAIIEEIKYSKLSKKSKVFIRIIQFVHYMSEHCFLQEYQLVDEEIQQRTKCCSPEVQVLLGSDVLEINLEPQPGLVKPSRTDSFQNFLHRRNGFSRLETA